MIAQNDCLWLYLLRFLSQLHLRRIFFFYLLRLLERPIRGGGMILNPDEQPFPHDRQVVAVEYCVFRDRFWGHGFLCRLP